MDNPNKVFGLLLLFYLVGNRAKWNKLLLLSYIECYLIRCRFKPVPTIVHLTAEYVSIE